MPDGLLSESGAVVVASAGDAGLRHLKLQLYLALSFAFCVVYFSLQRFPLFPTQPLPLTSVDRAIGFHPEWIYVYQSVYLLVPLFPFLARTREELMQYTLGFGVLCGIGFLIFALVPIVCPRPDDETQVAMFRLMLSYDGKINTIPSLHVGLSVYSVLFGYQLSETARGLRFIVWIGVAWTALIAYAALATKQHYAVDVPPGVVLAWVAHRVAARRRTPS